MATYDPKAVRKAAAFAEALNDLEERFGAHLEGLAGVHLDGEFYSLGRTAERRVGLDLG